MSQSELLFKQALQYIPGGVNSPVRAFSGVGGVPLFFAKGEGAYLQDEDGQKYIDYVGSWGPLILGHCHPKVLEAITNTLANGMSFGAPTKLEIELAKKIISLVPSIEKVRMVNSGTEATMTAVRLARGATGRDKIIKFNGCYHGHSDGLLVKAGSGVLTLGLPSSPGIPKSITEHTLSADFNNLEHVKSLFETYKEDIAGIIVEPVAGNMGFVPPVEGFLKGLRELCNQYGALLIFDEVMSGFRVALGGAQALYNVKPDITTFGKVIGGGMPVGAIGGRADIMAYLAPEGAVYQAGTLSGNPLAMAAGLATLCQIEQEGFFDSLSNTALALTSALEEAASAHRVPFKAQALGGMFGFYFTNMDSVCNYEDVAKGNLKRFKQFFHGMLAEGIYFAPSMFEAGFVSSAHGYKEIERTRLAAEKVFSQLA